MNKELQKLLTVVKSMTASSSTGDFLEKATDLEEAWEKLPEKLKNLQQEVYIVMDDGGEEASFYGIYSTLELAKEGVAMFIDNFEVDRGYYSEDCWKQSHDSYWAYYSTNTPNYMDAWRFDISKYTMDK